ncbi:MAG: GNAT family N-acetyltransferase [Alphaproteobacteria bacterium]
MSLENPILLDLPLPIYTERLISRPVTIGDGKAVFEAIDESRAEFEPWLPWVNSVKKWQDSEITAREFCSNVILRKAFHFVIIYNANIIGMCSLEDINWNISSGGIGYWCRTSATGNGFMQEAVAAITKYGFEVIKLKKYLFVVMILI